MSPSRRRKDQGWMLKGRKRKGNRVGETDYFFFLKGQNG
jgi:hypothetical protein